ncbi:MAG: hypothetical protein HY392_03465 [Candidatus Diapherotrites archaeon]|nr:hypothetical protein [Candidatus Diapherotrites archaeon]
MIEVEGELKKWGNSVGVVLPKKTLEKEHLRAGQKVRLLISKKENALKKSFGIAKFSRSTKEILGEVDKEAWDE